MAKKTLTKSKKKKVFKALFSLIVIVALLIVGYFFKDDFMYYFNTVNNSSSVASNDDNSNTSNNNTQYEQEIVDNVTFDNLQIYFLELGNASTGDSTFIKAGETDILIDAGSVYASSETIKEFVNQHCTDGKLEYVITTHAHKDHWAGMFGNSKTTTNYKGESVERTGIYYYYEIGTIIDFALTNQNDTSTSNDYYKYKNARSYAINKGSQHYTAAQCFNNIDGAKSTYVLDEANNITMDILYNKYYFETSSDENNYSVCTMINYNNHHFMLTGDLEKKGEEELAAYYDGSTNEKTLPEVDLFKAGHHGSNTSSNNCLLNIIKPKICCVCCCAGTTEYTIAKNNTFPTQDFINRIANYTDRVYVTSVINESQSRENGKFVYESLNGTITISSNGTNIGINASNNTTKLKDSDWFNGTCYVDSSGNVSSKSYNYYNESDNGVTAVARRIWPTN